MTPLFPFFLCNTYSKSNTLDFEQLPSPADTFATYMKKKGSVTHLASTCFHVLLSMMWMSTWKDVILHLWYVLAENRNIFATGYKSNERIICYLWCLAQPGNSQLAKGKETVYQKDKKLGMMCAKYWSHYLYIYNITETYSSFRA